MAIRLSDVLGRTVAATDGEIGYVRDVLFDDRTWKLRYIVIDTGRWLPGRKVVLTPSAFAPHCIEGDNHFRVTLSKESVKESPLLAEHQPISRQYEVLLYNHYAWEPYWGAPLTVGMPPYPAGTYFTHEPATSFEQEKWLLLQKEREARFEGHLRSLNTIKGYQISTTDDKEFGKVSDAIFHENEWQIIDLIIKSRKWIPGGQEFVISPMFVVSINEVEDVLHVKQTKSDIVDGPEFNFDDYGEDYRTLLVQHYRGNQPNLTNQQGKDATSDYRL